MPLITKFNSFIEAVHEGDHNFSTDVIKIMLTNDEPSPTDSEESDIIEIVAGNGYLSGGPIAATIASFQKGGRYSLALGNVEITAAGGDIGPFQYAVVYNDTATSKHLIGYYDAGEEIVIEDSKPFMFAFTAAFLTASYS